jgi:hypothetical protein
MEKLDGRIYLTLDEIEANFDYRRSTIHEKFRDAGITPTGGLYSLAEVCRAMYGDLLIEKTGLTASQRRISEFLEAQMNGNLIDAQELMAVMAPMRSRFALFSNTHSRTR